MAQIFSHSFSISDNVMSILDGNMEIVSLSKISQNIALIEEISPNIA